MKKTGPLWLLFVCFLIIGFSSVAAADELKVCASGDQGTYASLTAAVSAAASGDTIRLEPGVYAQPQENYPILVDKPVTIVGEEGVILDGSPFKAILEVTSPNVTIEGVGFHFLRWGVLGLADGLIIRDCSFHLTDATYRVSSCGIWLAGAYSCTVEDCQFTGCGLCLAGPPLSERSKSMPVLTGLFEVGEDLELFTSHTIRNNHVNGKPLYYIVDQKDLAVPQDAGGLIAVNCENLTIEGIDVSDSSMGIEVVHSKNVRVIDTTADRCGIFGIYLAYIEGGLAKRVTSRRSNHGIDIRDAQNMAVVDCLTEDCEQGVFFSWGFDNITERCRILRCGNGYFAAAGSDNQITRCVIDGNENGIYLQGEENTFVSDNEIMGNTVVGLRMLRSGGQCVKNAIHNNWAGVIITTTENATLWENTFNDNASASLYIRDLSGGKITSNDFRGEMGAYLELDGALSGTLIRGNMFEGGQERIVNRMQTPFYLPDDFGETE